MQCLKELSYSPTATYDKIFTITCNESWNMYYYIYYTYNHADDEHPYNKRYNKMAWINTFMGPNE